MTSADTPPTRNATNLARALTAEERDDVERAVAASSREALAALVHTSEPTVRRALNRRPILRTSADAVARGALVLLAEQGDDVARRRLEELDAGAAAKARASIKADASR